VAGAAAFGIAKVPGTSPKVSISNLDLKFRR
jgi:hypothetical protein